MLPIPHFQAIHLTLWWAGCVSSLMLQRGPRIAGIGLALLGIPIALGGASTLGVHFPLDMLGAAHGRSNLFLAHVARSAVVSGGRATGLPLGIHHRIFGKVDRAGMGARMSLWAG